MAVLKPQTPRRKALNTLVQGLAVTVGVTAVTLFGALVGDASSFKELGSSLIAYSTFQAIATGAVTWFVRGYVDGKRGVDSTDYEG